MTSPRPPRGADPAAHADFDAAGREPSLWVNHARRLLRAANAVRRELPSHLAALRGVDGAPDDELVPFGPYLLLSGLAIENLLKAVLVQRRPDLLGGGKLGKLKT